MEGVVITFVDITERKHTADALEAAERQAELANAAKSRFLAAASHDLRQPLQTLSLVRGILAKKIKEKKNDEALKLIARLDETTDAMSGMLNGLLDINQIEAGSVRKNNAKSNRYRSGHDGDHYGASSRNKNPGMPVFTRWLYYLRSSEQCNDLGSPRTV